MEDPLPIGELTDGKSDLTVLAMTFYFSCLNTEFIFQEFDRIEQVNPTIPTFDVFELSIHPVGSMLQDILHLVVFKLSSRLRGKRFQQRN